MSDPNTPGEPVEEPTSVDDVVGTANEGLAHAEAAGRDAMDQPVVAQDDMTVQSDESPADEVSADASEEIPWYERDDVPLDPIDESPTAATVAGPAYEPEPVDVEADSVAPVADDRQTTVLAPAEAVIAAPAAGGSAQPIFVQAPEPPRPRGNRGAAGGIGLLAAISFGILYLGVGLGLGLIDGTITGDGIGAWIMTSLTSWALWVPVAVFFIAFWLLGAIVNRGRWGHWVVFGLLVGVAAYGGHILGQMFQAPFWELTASEGEALVQGQLLVPLAIAAFVIGRELTIWFGAWVAARGKRVTELNYEAQREYERTLEAGPPIVPTAQG